MKLVILGTVGYHPNDHRHTACLMIPELGVVFDAGTAAYRIRDYLTTDTLDIFLSHAHLDHVVGLTFLLDVLNGREMKHVAVHGEKEKLDAVEQHLFSRVLISGKASLRLEGPHRRNHARRWWRADTLSPEASWRLGWLSD